MSWVQKPDDTMQAIRMVAETRPGATQLEILKFLYLADVESHMILGEPITEFQWIRYKKGPFDSDVYVALERMDGTFLRVDREQRLNGSKILRSHPIETVSMSCSLPPLKRAILKGILCRYRDHSITRILADVYATKPMREAARNEPLDLAQLDWRKKPPPNLIAAAQDLPDDPVLASLLVAPMDDEDDGGEAPVPAIHGRTTFTTAEIRSRLAASR